MLKNLTFQILQDIKTALKKITAANLNEQRKDVILSHCVKNEYVNVFFTYISISRHDQQENRRRELRYRSANHVDFTYSLSKYPISHMGGSN